MVIGFSKFTAKLRSMVPNLQPQVYSPSEEERTLATHSSRQLSALLVHSQPSISISVAQDDSGQPIVIPTVALNLLTDILAQMAQGNAVTLLPHHAELTTQEAAALLNVSRPCLMTLIESGVLPARWVGKHQRIYVSDVMSYKEHIDRARHETLDGLVAQAQELGMGYE
jgi:excisionase family DNA binding protein